jgi:hypothetical protein
MSEAHTKLAIEQRHFNLVAMHMVEARRELGIPKKLSKRLLLR